MKTLIVTVFFTVCLNAGFDISNFRVMHEGQEVTVKRQNMQNCNHPTAPEFIWQQEAGENCYEKIATFAGGIQPFVIDNKVKTIGEKEVLSFMKAAKDNDAMMLVDARGDHWMVSGTIPSAVNISHDSLEYLELLHDNYVATMKKIGVKTDAKTYDFTDAKELVVFCNGAWCPQSGWFIQNLIKIGYPKEKIKWYRGGITSWVMLGLTIVK